MSCKVSSFVLFFFNFILYLSCICLVSVLSLSCHCLVTVLWLMKTSRLCLTFYKKYLQFISFFLKIISSLSLRFIFLSCVRLASICNSEKFVLQMSCLYLIFIFQTPHIKKILSHFCLFFPIMISFLSCLISGHILHVSLCL